MSRSQRDELMNSDELKNLVDMAAKSADYEVGFGIRDCDLTNSVWWSAYQRQSLEEQTKNNRLSDYLRTCAIEAKKLGAIVPLDYILYDAVTGEHLERPHMKYLRKLIVERKIKGVIFPTLDRLSREPVHQQIFEIEAAYYNVQVHYADVPSGNDPGSQFARSIMAHAAKATKLANRKNALGGNIGRVVKGWAPAHRAPYGYTYKRDAEIGTDGRVYIKRAWWEINELDPDGNPVLRSPAWVVVQMFKYLSEGRTLYWIASYLNEIGITTPEGGKWSTSRVAKVAHRHCYTGNHQYNVNARVTNPDRPLLDITAELKRTLIRPKPKEEWVQFTVPALLSEEVWQRANRQIKERGRGRGKEGKSIQALLRNRIYCPECNRPMVVRRDGHQHLVYYHCSKYGLRTTCGFNDNWSHSNNRARTLQSLLDYNN
jgi:site-specific DNA recombinase